MEDGMVFERLRENFKVFQGSSVKMLFRILADAVVLVHFLWILFLIFGAFLGVRNKTIKYLHLSGLFFAILIQIFGWYCPLTHLEFWLRSRHDPSVAYAGSFIIYYIERLVYLEISPTVIFLTTIGLVIFNFWYICGRNKDKPCPGGNKIILLKKS